MRARAPFVVALAAVMIAGAAHADPSVQPEGVIAKSPMPARNLRTLVHDPAGYDPARTTVATDLLLGDLLFHAPAVLGDEAVRLGLSCNTCHPNGAAHTTLVLGDLSDRPGNVDLTTAHFRAGADDHRKNPANIPSLRGARYTAPYGRDGRMATLSEVTQHVVMTELGGKELSARELSALVAYVQDLDFVPNANLDRLGRLTARASDSARRGEASFEKPRAGFGGKSCASCHPASSYFRDGLVHRIASAPPPSPSALEDGFDTPTLLGTSETAPYFHDGSVATLADVVDFFDRTFALAMSARERSDLTAYLQAIGAVDTTTDDRPIAQKMIDVFVYLELGLSGDSKDDRRVWTMALDLAASELAARISANPSLPEALVTRARADGATLASLRSRVTANAPLAPLRSELRDLSRELTRLSADLQGALSAASR